ncbi:PQQ-binding-like beta-propeller repeat protein [Salinirubrum litoreum]|uniref:PQQ-binding-like beta-propeller repeat protein n=1 Tax=Salinirubrum litoreum TaxID=1126234 RepID=A0ABD5RGR2_9EURY|nr:PQQ-binding-like beta-propeller repeat protein [Salinirubrum litoreum]
MPSFTRRDALRGVSSLALGVGIAGCTGGREEFPVTRAWHGRPREPSPAAGTVDGTLLTGSYSPFDDDPLIAGVDANTGESEWAVSVSKGDKSPVCVSGGRAYAFADSGFAVAVDAASGDEVWRHSIGRVADADPGVTEFAPVDLGDRVVVPVSGTEEDVTDRLHGLDADTGEERFVHEIPSSLAGAPGVAGGGIVFPTVTGRLVALTADGDRRWERSITGAASSVGVAPDGRTVVVGTPAERLLALDAETGEVTWRGRLRNTVFARPLVTADRVYVGGADYVLRAFDRESGEPLWQDDLVSPITHGPYPVGDRLVTLVCGSHRVRGTAGDLPFGPTVLYVHERDGTRVRSVRFDGRLDGGEVHWLSVVDGDVYLGQAYGLTKLASGVTRRD